MIMGHFNASDLRAPRPSPSMSTQRSPLEKIAAGGMNQDKDAVPRRMNMQPDWRHDKESRHDVGAVSKGGVLSVKKGGGGLGAAHC